MAFFFSRKANDKASAIFTMTVISMLFLVLCLGFALDLTKNAYLKNAQNSQAQQAAEIAVKQVDTQGSLVRQTSSVNTVPAAVNEFVAEYARQKGSTYVKYNEATAARHTDETETYKAGVCSVRPVKRYGGNTTDVKMPYMLIRLEPVRKAGQETNGAMTAIYESLGGGAPYLVAGGINPSLKYRVISAEVHDSSVNLMLGLFNMPCQDMNSQVSGIAFGNKQDLS